jgi:hypothetical protein
MTAIVVTGSRGFTDYDLLLTELTARNPTRIIHGGARGADSLSTDAAHELHVSLQIIRAHWNLHGNCRCRDKKRAAARCSCGGPAARRAREAAAAATVRGGSLRGG